MHTGADGLFVWARLHVVLEAIETTEVLISQIREAQSGYSQRELRAAAALMAEVKDLIRRLIDEGTGESNA